MGLVLSLETATHVCSVSLAKDGEVVASRESQEEKSHASQLTVFIQKVLQAYGVKPAELDAVAVSKGPGSYTGLRIGVSTAKGLCYGADIPLIAIDTLQAMASGLMKQEDLPDEAVLFPMIDARRMEVYAAAYSSVLEQIRAIGADIVEADTYKEWLDKAPVYFFGTGADKLTSVINHENARFVKAFLPSACFMAELADEALLQKRFEDVAYFEPFYLKEFMATIPKKHIYR